MSDYQTSLDAAVTCAIPGAKRIIQVEENASAANLPPLSDETMRKVMMRGVV